MESFFRYNKLILTQSGSWPIPNQPLTELNKLGILLIHICVWIISCVVIIWEVYENGSDILIIVEGVLEIFAILQIIFRNIFGYVKQNVLLQLLKLTDELLTNTPVNCMDTKIQEITLKWQKRAHFWVKLVYFTFFTPLLIFLMIPWWRYYKTSRKTFVYVSRFRESNLEWKYYIPLLIVEGVSGYSLIMLQIGLTTLFSTAIMLLSSNLSVLEYCMKLATLEAIQNGRTTPLFGRCIEYHKQILRAYRMLDAYYSPILLLQFLISGISICVSLYLCSQENVEPGKKVLFKFWLLSMLLELFVYCFYGQLLQSNFESLFIDGFYIPWYMAPLAFQKNFTFFLTFCSKPVMLTAYKMASVNLELYFLVKYTIARGGTSFRILFDTVDSIPISFNHPINNQKH